MLTIPTKTSSIVRRRWHSYLQAQGLTPHDFGATTWGDVVPDTARGDAGAGNTSAAGNPLKLPARKLFYWSIRFAHWDSCRYMAEWSAALQLASGDPSLQTCKKTLSRFDRASNLANQKLSPRCQLEQL